MKRFDIAIVGAGIAGSALSAALADSGLSIVVLDKRTNSLDTARGDAIQPVMCETLAKWGVLQALIDAGAEKRYATRWFDSQGSQILSIPVELNGLKAPWFRFLNHEVIGKCLIRHAIDGGAKSIEGIKSWSVERMPDGWTLEIKDSESKVQQFSATMLVGADGTGSLVRKQLRIEDQVHRYKYPIAVFWGRESCVSNHRTLDVHLTEDRIVSMIPRTQGGSKIAFPIDRSELSEWRACDSKTICKRLRQWSSAIDLSQAKFGAIYLPVSVQTERWTGEGASVLLGDACHAMHHARSMGMNTCFRLADALAESLKDLGPGFSENDASKALAQFENEFKPIIDKKLTENHIAGQEMDTLAGEGFPQLRSRLQTASTDQQTLQRMALSAAGL